MSISSSSNSNFHSSLTLNEDKEIKDCRQQLHDVSCPSLFNRYLIVGKNGLEQTNAFVYIFATLKGLFGYPKVTNRYVIGLEALRLVLKADEVGVNTQKDYERITALVKRVGLLSGARNGSEDIKGLVEEIRHKFFDPSENSSLDEKKKRNILLLKRYIACYQKQLTSNFPEVVEKVNHQFISIFGKQENHNVISTQEQQVIEAKVTDSQEQVAVLATEDAEEKVIDSKEQITDSREQVEDVQFWEKAPHASHHVEKKLINTEKKRGWTISRQDIVLGTIVALGTYLTYQKFFSHSVVQEILPNVPFQNPVVNNTIEKVCEAVYTKFSDPYLCLPPSMDLIGEFFGEIYKQRHIYPFKPDIL